MDGLVAHVAQPVILRAVLGVARPSGCKTVNSSRGGRRPAGTPCPSCSGDLVCLRPRFGLYALVTQPLVRVVPVHGVQTNAARAPAAPVLHGADVRRAALVVHAPGGAEPAGVRSGAGTGLRAVLASKRARAPDRLCARSRDRATRCAACAGRASRRRAGASTRGACVFLGAPIARRVRAAGFPHRADAGRLRVGRRAPSWRLCALVPLQVARSKKRPRGPWCARPRRRRGPPYEGSTRLRLGAKRARKPPPPPGGARRAKPPLETREAEPRASETSNERGTVRSSRVGACARVSE